MTHTWPRVPLGEVLKLALDVVPIDPSATYRMAGVYSFGRGLFARGLLGGSETTYKAFHLLHENDLVLSQLKAWEGAIGRVTKEFEGWYLSPQFPTFRAIPGRLEIRFIEWLCKQPSVWEELERGSRGMGARRNSVSPKQFLSLRVPLPPLSEQRRIVARIEELAAKIDEAFRVRQSAGQESFALLRSLTGEVFDSLEKEFPRKFFGSFEPHVTSGPRNWAARYHEQGYRFYRAQDIGPDGRIISNSRVFIDTPDTDQGRGARLVPGDLMIVITGATVGRCAIFREENEPGFVNQHVALCRLPETEVEARFALWALTGPHGQRQLIGQRYGQGKPGLNLQNIRSLEFPFPPLEEQRRIVAYLDELQAKVDGLKLLQAETAAELDALLPSILDKAFNGEL